MSDVPAQHRSYGPQTVSFASLTVSDTRSVDTDQSGMVIRKLATDAGHRVLASEIVPDEFAAIQFGVTELLGIAKVDAVVVSGGTGFAPRDVTIEAVSGMFERTIDGFGELFRTLSYEEVGAASMLSRATAGVVGSRATFVLPGSPSAVELGMRQLILPEIGHLLGQIRRR